jgi:hypothetical protein
LVVSVATMPFEHEIPPVAETLSHSGADPTVASNPGIAGLVCTLASGRMVPHRRLGSGAAAGLSALAGSVLLNRRALGRGRLLAAVAQQAVDLVLSPAGHLRGAAELRGVDRGIPALGVIVSLLVRVACDVVSRGSGSDLEHRVVRTAEAALAQRSVVTAIDVLVGLGWLEPRRVDEWRQGRADYLERVTVASLGKISTAMRCFHRWAQGRGLKPSETAYVARTRGRQPLRFSKSGDPGIERAYRTHWVAPELSERKRARLAERQSRPPDLVVVSPVKEWTCSLCGSEDGGWLIMENSGPVCMGCADMEHLVFLPSGDAALTRRAKAASRLSAVVVRFSRSRRRYERQGILVEEDALERAEQECLADEDARARRREREAQRRANEDLESQARMAQEIARLFPGCPADRARAIASHAAARGSGRVGRSAAGRALDPGAIELAVAAAVRHQDTRYDELLMSGLERQLARAEVRAEVARVLADWRRS